MIKVVSIVIMALCLQGCITKIVTVPVKVAYKTTEGVVAGTVSVVDAVIPSHNEEETKNNKLKDIQ